VQQLAAVNLSRDANTLIYGDSKLSEDAIDRVVSNINQECVAFVISLLYFTYDSSISIQKNGKFSYKWLNEDEADITHINVHNRVLKKGAAFFLFVRWLAYIQLTE